MDAQAPRTKAPAVLRAIGLTRYFKAYAAVDHLDLEILPGEVFGLLGPNGAGKTTTIKMLTTLLPPSSGEAFVDGFDVRRHPGSVRASIGYVPQLVSADGTLSGYENLLVFAKLYDIPAKGRKALIRDTLEVSGLTEAADKAAKEYSGGMIRRLEIAQSMMHRPKLLFLDEPTVGLDPSARKMVWERLESLRKDYGTTIFLTTHFMEEADSLCARVAIMHHGKVVAAGSPAELKASIGKSRASLDDVFMHYSGSTIESSGAWREIARNRRSARRLG
jgi:ABC-2 type transport system ATP-binding protein